LLDLLYARGVGARRRWFERHPDARRRLRQPVVSVGNLSVGGEGKTPLVASIAAWLMARGERPAILSRGYKRRERLDGVVVVSAVRQVLASVERAGDEPLMLARALPGAIVCVCEDRYLAGVLAERQLGASMHLLDDGFQHVHLAREIDILVTRPGEISSGRVLPFGRLREARSAAARAHFVVVMDADTDTARAEAWELGISEFAAARRRIEPVTGDAVESSRRVLAVAGIARPEQFFEMLRVAGYQVAQTLAFADHHRYRLNDLARIAAAARDAGVEAVVTTQKDAVRFEPLAPLPFMLRSIPMSLVIDQWDALAASVEEAVRRTREPA
jgi:tetraacyldisaccharide 4'-kinase